MTKRWFEAEEEEDWAEEGLEEAEGEVDWAKEGLEEAVEEEDWAEEDLGEEDWAEEGLEEVLSVSGTSRYIRSRTAPPDLRFRLRSFHQKNHSPHFSFVVGLSAPSCATLRPRALTGAPPRLVQMFDGYRRGICRCRRLRRRPWRGGRCALSVVLSPHFDLYRSRASNARRSSPPGDLDSQP